MLLRTAFLCTLALALAAAPGVPATRPTAAAAAAFKYESVGLECTFEETCAWKWNATAPGGFRVVSVSEAGFLGPQAPLVDASNNEDGHFLLLTGLDEPRLWIVNSPKYAATSEHCRLSVELHMANMQQGHFKVVVSGKNSSWWVSEKMGTNNRRWDKYKFPLGRVSQEFNIILEIETSNKSSHGHLAMDNIELLDCFPKPPQNGCTGYRYHCDNETCVERDRVCDIKPDCPNGEDEDPELCDAGFPSTATHCSFENGWCGWNNTMNNSFNWVLHNGSSASNYTGPLYDHTYENATGTYMYLNMSQSSMFAEEAVAQSPIYYPPPPCHSNSSSPYFKSCKIRFYHHHFGRHNAALRLYLIELDKKQNPRELWRSYGVRSNKWYWKVVTLPNVTERYYFRFEARRGFGGLGDFGIDDVSMSPECFGKALPDNETIDIGYRYGHSYLSMKKSPAAMSHPDFANKPHYYLSTCGAKGRLGPRHTDCQQVYNNTSTLVSVLSKDPFFGVQKWIAPEGAYYTIIAKGASGGLGSEGNGSSLGATARLVVELHKGQSLYILVGQEGTGNTCWAGVTCPSISLDHRSPKTSMAHKIHKHIITGGGGGGGSFVFKLNDNWTEAMPVVVAGGGGGLCEGVVDDGRQHGHGVRPERKPITGIEYGVTAADDGGGAGGGWRKGPQPQREITGSALLRGGQGGKPCNRNGDGTGGFGGGGSGCHTGGGGGGYSGGNSWSNESSVGEGGSSYIGSGWLGEITEGAHDGPGEVFIIPAIAGCKCDYKCVALDEYRHDVKCICPDNWELASDNHSCISTILTGDNSPSSLLILVICVAPFIIISAVVASFFLWKRKHAKRKYEAGKISFTHVSIKDEQDSSERR